jgi:hypothetical protein
MSFRLFRFDGREPDSHAFARCLIGRVVRLPTARPAWAEVTHLRFEAFDLKAHAGAAGERQDHFA